MKDIWQKYRYLLLIIFVFCMTATMSFFSTSNMSTSSAVSTSDFNPGNIISDAVMSNYNSMSVADIQNFLTSKNSCNNTNEAYWRQLENQYPNLDWHFENGHFVCLSEERFGDTWTEIGTGQTAAEIIYQAAQDYHINPQVLLVLLEKEQSLISDTFPNSNQYRSATGYGCPDTAACDSKYYGFKNQIRNAAALFRNVLDNGYSVYPEKTHGVYISYNPNSACGRSEVYIENRATAALYRYTPYQPNAAALNAGYGIGDGCSAYGNRNFYLYFTSWFGSTQAAIEGEQIAIPDGEYSLVSASATQLSLQAAGTANDANVQLSTLDLGDQSSRWRFEHDINNTYKITNVASGKVLDLKSNATSAGTNIQIYASDNTCGQRWRLYRTTDGSLVIETACATGMVVDLASGAKTGVNVQLNVTSKNSAGQKWQLRIGKTVEDGVYTIHSQLDQTKVIEVYGDYTHDGANVDLWEQNEKENRKWKVTYDPRTDYYSFVNPFSNKALDVYNGDAHDGANVAIYYQNSGCAQKWQIIPQADGSYNIINACKLGYSLDVVGASTKDGTDVHVWSTNQSSSERWYLNPVEQLVQDGVYNIISSLSRNIAMDIYGAKTTTGANVSIWELHSNASEQWRIQYNASTDDYTLFSVLSDKALDVYDANMSNGSNIQAWDPNGTCAQRWRIVRLFGAYQFISACNSDKVIDLYNANVINGSNINLWSQNYSDAQRWELIKL